MSTEDERKLFVAGLPDSMTEDVLRQLFEATGGTVVNVTLPKHRDTGRPRGFGFVTLATSDEAAAARDQLDGSLQAGRSISVRPFQSEPPRRDARDAPGPPSANTGDRTLYVGNLPYDAAQADLEAVFSEQGVSPVVRIHLPVGPDGRMRGFGFVTMGSAEAANAAIVALRGVEMKGRALMVNIAHPRGERPSGGMGGDRPSFGGGGFDRGPSSRRDMGPPPSGGFQEFPPSPPGDAGGRGAPDRRAGPSAPATDWAKKKKKGRLDQGGAKKGRENRKWEDWDDD
jgi:RNA recognition motif-containing protein